MPVGNVIGDLLPLALGVAISPIPIIAMILMLLSARPGGASSGFLTGWIVGIIAATTIFVLLAGTLDLGRDTEPSTAASWVKLVLGVLLLLLAARQWQGRPAEGETPTMPKWMASIDQFTATKAGGLAVLLEAVNPKNLLMCAAAGTTIAGGNLSGAQDVGAVAIFTVIAASTVAAPVLAYAVGRKRMAGPLVSLRGWLTLHNVAVMATLVLVIGVVLIGKGLGGLL
jgi:hypothetical protein